tara:strand:- start:43 stop:465 length:423 start_codon:yes stop_codon:yes gene_type:complete
VAYITGLDGSVTLTNDYGAKLNTWSATMSRTPLDMTAFADPQKRRALGIIDLTGSAGGHMIRDVGNSDPLSRLGETTTDAAGVSVILTAHPGNGTACSITATCVMDSIAVSSDVNGDATVQFNFQLSGGLAPAILWDENA